MTKFICHLGFVALVILSTSTRLAMLMGKDKTPYEFTDVQLVGGPNSGRVQVQVDHRLWLDVCDRMWDNDDGEVVCRQLGYPGVQRTESRRFSERSSDNEAVRDFRCQGDELTLSQCEHKESSDCGKNNDGAGVTCIPFQTTETSTEETTAVSLTTETEGAATQVLDRTTTNIAGTTDKDEIGGTTAGETVTHRQTMGASIQASPVIISADGDGEFDAQGGSSSGAYIGLVLGCVLFVVCAGVIVVCLLKRHKKQDKPTATTALQPSAHNSQGSNHLQMRELRNSQAGNTAPKPADNSPKCRAVEERKSDFEVNTGGADYFTVEDGGDLVDNGQYTTGVVGEKATSKPTGKPRQTSHPSDDAHDNYYSYAKPEITKSSDPREDDVYTYADAPTEGVNNKPANTDYFAIEEEGSSMGSPLYNSGEGGGREPAMESEYSYADPTQFREEPSDETEGWVENIVYAPGP